MKRQEYAWRPVQGRSDTLWQLVLPGALTRVKLILLLILVKLSTVGYYPFWTADVLLENKCVGECTVSISNFKMHLQILFYNATVACLVAGLGITLMPDILHPNSLAKTPFSPTW